MNQPVDVNIYQARVASVTTSGDANNVGDTEGTRERKAPLDLDHSEDIHVSGYPSDFTPQSKVERLHTAGAGLKGREINIKIKNKIKIKIKIK